MVMVMVVLSVLQVVSRGHRLPKPYASLVRYQRSCMPDKSKVPWPAVGLEHQESVTRYNLSFRISRIYLQPIGDTTVQCLSCLGAHLVVQAVFWGLLGVLTLCGTCTLLQEAWRQSRQRRLWDLLLGVAFMVVVQGSAFYLTSHIR